MFPSQLALFLTEVIICGASPEQALLQHLFLRYQCLHTDTPCSAPPQFPGHILCQPQHHSNTALEGLGSRLQAIQMGGDQSLGECIPALSRTTVLHLLLSPLPPGMYVGDLRLQVTHIIRYH
jgi:hypothetical protein